MQKAVIYARVSSKEQDAEDFSIPAQLKVLNEYAISMGFLVVNEFKDNETAKQTGRTNFNEMIKYLKANKDVNIVLVEKTDRLYRNFKGYLTIGDLGLDIHFVKENVIFGKDARSQEKFLQEIRLVMAKNYVDNLSEEIKKGLMEKVEQGYLPSKPPIGYKRVNNKLVKIDPTTAPFVLRAFNLYAQGDNSLEAVCQQGNTIVLLGSSGAGKSSLINNLLGEGRMKIQELRKGIDKGKHTTSNRQMFILLQDGLIIDTPGMRELQLWTAEEGFSCCFDNIEELAINCRFNDCKHQNEPGCAVQKALEDGSLDIKRYENYVKMKKELAYLSRKQNHCEALQEKEKWKKITKQIKSMHKE